ncbi:MAG: hypothetical protein AAGJ97_16000, partial [Planctomycetota bacterium]
VELIVRGGKSLTAVLTDGEGNAVATDGGYLTLTFTESDGEKEDYKIDAGRAEGTFMKTSGHVIGHIVRDAMSVTASVGGAEYSSETFNFPHGPNGGEVVALGGSKLVVELVVDGDVVRVHVLNAKKRPKQVGAEEVTLTFTEPDGELEDYTIPVGSSEKKTGTVFEIDDDHVAMHVMRDKIAVKLVVDEKTLESETFSFSAK